MEKTPVYPTPEEIIEYNTLALSMIYATKGDRHQVLSKQKIIQAIEDCKKQEGGPYGKAAVLLEGLIRAHAFASGNRRTAFLAMKAFLAANGENVGVEDRPENANVLRGIREGFYSHEEIKEWLDHGKIREHQR